MKYLFLLLFIFSCATEEKVVEQIPTEEAAPESNAKPVSPYTVKPCYCMKIFRPVCADGMNYGNSCEAECHGHTTWTEGKCGKK